MNSAIWRICNYAGCMMILFTLEHHYHVDFTWWEAALLGGGIGLAID